MRSSRLNVHPVPHTLSVPAPFFGGGGLSYALPHVHEHTRRWPVCPQDRYRNVRCVWDDPGRLPPGVTAHLMDLMKTKGPNQRAVVRVRA